MTISRLFQIFKTVLLLQVSFWKIQKNCVQLLLHSSSNELQIVCSVLSCDKLPGRLQEQIIFFIYCGYCEVRAMFSEFHINHAIFFYFAAKQKRTSNWGHSVKVQNIWISYTSIFINTFPNTHNGIPSLPWKVSRQFTIQL